MIVLTLKDDLVIPAGTRFLPGPRKTEYGGHNYEAGLPLSDDETARCVVFLDGPAGRGLFAETGDPGD